MAGPPDQYGLDDDLYQQLLLGQESLETLQAIQAQRDGTSNSHTATSVSGEDVAPRSDQSGQSTAGTGGSVSVAGTPASAPSSNPVIDVVSSISITIHAPPANMYDDDDYLNRCKRAAAYLGKPVQIIGKVPSDHDDQYVRNVVGLARQNVFSVVNDVNFFIYSAKIYGFSPPDNPFSEMMSFSSPSALSDYATALKIYTNIQNYLFLLQTKSAIDFENRTVNSAQLATINISLDGFGAKSGWEDLIKELLPDGDAVKARKVRDALAVLNFEARIPRVLFTADYSPDGKLEGCVIGWRKMPDASGFILKKREFFSDKESRITLSKRRLEMSTADLSDYVKKWILSFYDDVDSNKIYAYLDSNIKSDEYNTYGLSAYQIKKDISNSLFDGIETRLISLSSAQKSLIESRLSALAPGNSSRTISPYPLIAEQIFQDSEKDKYDWILAGVNVKASAKRGEGKSVTRQYSYLTADWTFLSTRLNLTAPTPTGLSQFKKNIDDAIATYGVVQVLSQILQETGILFFFEGKDMKDNMSFDRVNLIDPNSSEFLTKVLNAIDPETMTLDLSSLSTNLATIVDHSIIYGTSWQGKLGEPLPSTPTEIAVLNPSDVVTATTSEDQIQFANMIVDGNEIVDLTTFDGMSKFIRTIRVFSDFGPNIGLAPSAPPRETPGELPAPSFLSAPTPGTTPSSDESPATGEGTTTPSGGWKPATPK